MQSKSLKFRSYGMVVAAAVPEELIECIAGMTNEKLFGLMDAIVDELKKRGAGE